MGALDNYLANTGRPSGATALDSYLSRADEERRQKEEARKRREEYLASLAAAGAMPTAQAEQLGPDPGAFVPAARQAANQLGGFAFAVPERLGMAPPGTYQQMQQDIADEQMQAMAHG